MWWIIFACASTRAPTEPAPEPVAAEPDETPEPAPAPVPVVDTTCAVELHPFTDADVYGKPEKGAAPIGTVPEGTLLHVEGVTGPWARVRPVDLDTALPTGWLGISLLTTNLRTKDEYDTRGRYRDTPSGGGGKPVPELASLTVESCKGPFLKVAWEQPGGQVGGGWLTRADHCPLSNTTCE